MTKKELESENERLRKGLERIRGIADAPQSYAEKVFRDKPCENSYAWCLGVILSISEAVLTDKP